MKKAPIFFAGILLALGPWTIPGAHADNLVVGTGPGGDSLVRVFNHLGDPLVEFTAFTVDENESGAVRPAAGDLDGDGDAEIVVVGGSAIASTGHRAVLIKVYDAEGQYTSQYALVGNLDGTTPLDGAYVSLGDVDGDGDDEIFVGQGASDYQPAWVQVFDGNPLGFQGLMWVASDPLNDPTPPNPAFVYAGIRVAAAKGSDGLADVAVANGPYADALALARTFDAGGTFIRQFVSYYTTHGVNGSTLTAIQYDADPQDEFVVAHGPAAVADSIFRIFDDDGTILDQHTAFTDFANGVQMAVGDFDDDGEDEFAAGQNAGAGSESSVRLFRHNGAYLRQFEAFDSLENPQGGVYLATLPGCAPDCPPDTISLEITRTYPTQGQLPDVTATATILDTNGDPWEGDVEITAANPDGYFEPPWGMQITGVTSLGNGQYAATVSADRSGEVEIEVTATHRLGTAEAAETVLFLPFVDHDWGIPRALTEINTTGNEDSVAVSPDGNTLYFSYSPLLNCGAPFAPLAGDCAQAVGPFTAPERPGVYGVDAYGSVTVGLYGVTDVPPAGNGWENSKPVFTGYAATRLLDGTFGDPVPIGFEDDGVLVEGSLVSGPVSPVAGQPYNLFFAYPDWLDFDADLDFGTAYAVATVTAGPATNLGGPLDPNPPVEWTWQSQPAGMLAQELTGPLQSYVEGHDVGEYRVYQDPGDSSYAIYLESRNKIENPGSCLFDWQCGTGNLCVNLTCTDDYDLVVSDLTGTYPVGEWGAPTSLGYPFNSNDKDETFPWVADLPYGGSTRKEIFFNRDPVAADPWSSPTRIMSSYRDGGAWTTPDVVLETNNGLFLPGSIVRIAMPAVAASAHGTEMYFVYAVLHSGPDDLETQIGVMTRSE